MNYRGWLLSGYAGTVLLLAGGGAGAQTPGSAASGTGVANETGIEEIVVMAQKRKEKLQDVPVSVTALSAAQLNAQGIQNVVDIGVLTPGLDISGGGGGITPFLRGVGNEATVVGNESSIAVYLDDVYQSRLNAGALALNNIDRIEVLKGPQGTLFGRNASGGLIAIYTRNPTQTPTAELTLGYDNYSTQLAKIYVSGGITDNIVADLSVVHNYQDNGWGKNFATGEKWGYENFDVLRSKWLFDVSENTKLRLIADYEHSKGDHSMSGNTYPGQTAGFYAFDAPSPGAARTPVGFYDFNSYFQNKSTSESSGIQARVDHDFSFATFASITAYRNTVEHSFTTGTGSPLNDIGYSLIAPIRTFTQELQLSSEAGSRFDWIVGLYYMNNASGYEPTGILGNGVGPFILGGAFGPCLGCRVNLYGSQKINDYSAYSQGTFHVLDDTNITLGLRYTMDELKGAGRTEAVFPGVGTITFPPGTSTKTARFYKPTYKIGLDHHFTEEVMGYISYSRGFKAGTFNTLPFNSVPAAPEVLDSTEIGFKSDLFDRRVQLNGAFFYYQSQHPQVQISNDGIVNVLNAGAAEIKGIDFDGRYRITPALRAQFGAEYLDAHYTSYQNAPFIYQNPNPPFGNFEVVTGNATGRNLPRAPRFSYNVGLDYGWDTSVGTFTFVTNYSWKSGFFWDPDNVTRQRSYGLLDASVTYELPGSDRWQFQLWAKNLTREKYIFDELEVAGPVGNRSNPGAPTTFGIQATFKFEG